MATQPTGTVTFLFTDVEASTRLWETHPAEMRSALALHDEIICGVIAAHRGYLFSTGGDGFAAAFASVGDAVGAAGEAQASLVTAVWPLSGGLRVRMGIHTGEANERGGDYFGPAVNRAARIMAAGHGGQVLLSGVSAHVLGTATLVDLGEHRLKDLGEPEHLWQLGGSMFPALRTLDRVLHNLGVQRTPLLGRDKDIGSVAALLGAHRVVSLLGIGGSGKTRLAQAVAAAVIEDFPDGVWFVDLVPVAAARAVPSAIASAAGIDLGGRDPAQALAQVMVGRRALFLLDNCEHLTDGVALLLDTMLERAAEPRFLVTSREPLELSDEQRFVVEPLDVSSVASPAVELFVSTAARRGSAIDEAALLEVMEICRRLDGLPLAVELAAGQVRHLAPADILARLDRRFELLASGRGARARRQVSLEAVLQDTWDLLADVEQALLLHLAAFPASFDLQSAEELFGTGTARALAGLVDRCVVVRDTGDHTYRLLETVRLFARNRWSERAEPDYFLDRHVDALRAHIERWSDDEIYSMDHVLGWHARHVEDLIAADDHLHARGDELVAAKLWSAGALLWHLGQPATAAIALERIDRCLASGKLDPATEARAELAAACAAMATRQPDRIRSAARRAIDAAAIAGCDTVRAFALNALSWMTMLNDLGGALALLEESEQLARVAGAPNVAVSAMTYRSAALALYQADGALALIEEAERANGGAASYAATVLASNRIKTSLFDRPEQTAAALGKRLAALRSVGVPASFQSLNYVALTLAATADRPGTLRALHAVENELRRSGVDDGLPDLLIVPAMLAYVLKERERARLWITAIRLAAKPTQSLPITAIYRQLRTRLGLSTDRDGLEETAAVYREARGWLEQVAAEGREQHALP